MTIATVSGFQGTTTSVSDRYSEDEACQRRRGAANSSRTRAPRLGPDEIPQAGRLIRAGAGGMTNRGITAAIRR